MSRTFPSAAVALVRAGYDLSLRQSAVLLRAVETPPDKAREWVTVRACSSALDVNKPSITRAMDRLCELGLAVRQTDTEDRRSVFLLPTKHGLDLAAEFMGAHVRAEPVR